MKRSEKTLLFVLLGLGVMGVAVVFSDYFFDARNRLLVEKEQLETEWITVDTLMEEKDLWEIRAHWLESQQPPFTSPEKMDHEIFQAALAADVKGVKATNQTLLPSMATPHYVQAGASVVAEGSLQDVFRWIHRLNQPGEFRLVRNLKVAPAKDDREQITASFELLRWYSLPRS